MTAPPQCAVSLCCRNFEKRVARLTSAQNHWSAEARLSGFHSFTLLRFGRCPTGPSRHPSCGWQESSGRRREVALMGGTISKTWVRSVNAHSLASYTFWPCAHLHTLASPLTGATSAHSTPIWKNKNTVHKRPRAVKSFK
ncbi:hypothetical protein M404DRAFT_539862 [Pisolithus tinctorius Marx 270]|uniref:Uncharacterized protein n=1 Tax=Pisolithus tinctorius Marx 270 TaxID=870435 RepID=A0A0C3NV72_PISTI|nr:hypothetical protein M404DRAFT_539862 [Pisolithus tinctorius Marx 270]